MSMGLQVWDGSGNIMLDITDRITRYIESRAVSIPATVAYVDISYPGVDSSTWFAYSDSYKLLPIVFSGYIRCYASQWYTYKIYSPGITGSIAIFRY